MNLLHRLRINLKSSYRITPDILMLGVRTVQALFSKQYCSLLCGGGQETLEVNLLWDNRFQLPTGQRLGGSVIIPIITFCFETTQIRRFGGKMKKMKHETKARMSEERRVSDWDRAAKSKGPVPFSSDHQVLKPPGDDRRVRL